MPFFKFLTKNLLIREGMKYIVSSNRGRKEGKEGRREGGRERERSICGKYGEGKEKLL